MTLVAETLSTVNSQPVALADVPVLAFDAFAGQLAGQLENNSSGLSALFGKPQGNQSLRLYAVTNHALTSRISVFATDVGDRYPSLTCDVPQAHWFEREIAEQWGVVPVGHPWLKPIRFHRSYVNGRDAWGRSSRRQDSAGRAAAGTDYFQVRGEEVHEVAVGPVHAGVIEPGHFRFQCHGEKVFHAGNRAGLSAPRHRTAAGRRSQQAHAPLHGNTGRRHDDRPRHRLLPGVGRPGRHRSSAQGSSHPLSGDGTGTTRQSHGRSRRAGAGRRLFADGVVLRTPPRRLAQYVRADLRKPLWAITRATRRSPVRHRRGHGR